MIRPTNMPWRWLVPGAALVALLVFPLLSPDDLYRQTVLFQTFLLAVGAISWNLISGFTGYISLGQSAFLGIGAYTTALLTLHLDKSPFVFAPVGALVAAVVAAVVGAIVLRARGHAFVIITIALLLLLQIVGLNLTSLTGGSNGLTLPIPTWSADILQFPFYYSMLAIMVAVLIFSMWIRRSKFGTGLIAIREDELKAASIGINTTRYKILGFTASAIFIGFAGGVYAYYLAFIDPRGMFDILVSVSIVLAVLVGGRGTIWGPLLGAFIVQPLNEATNVYARGSQSRLILFGGLLMATVLFMPDGIIPTVTRRLARRRRAGTSVASIEQAKVAESPAIARVDRAAQPAGRALLEVKGLSKSFGGLKAVDDCSFAVDAGTISALIGPNGSGKTTMFNLITGMMRADAGTIEFDGTRVERMRPWTRTHLGLGRSFQITRLFKEMTVLENVVAPLPNFRWRQLARNAVDGVEAQRAKELLEFVGMGGFADVRAGDLSFGQLKLVELAQTLMLEPRLILLDEPAGGINPTLVDRIVELVRTLNDGGITFLIVEHNMPMVLDLCDPVIVVAQGRPIAQGPPRDIQADPVVLDAYLGEDRGDLTESAGV